MPARAASNAKSPDKKRFFASKSGGWYATMADAPTRTASSHTEGVRSMHTSTRAHGAARSPTRRPTLSHDAA